MDKMFLIHKQEFVASINSIIDMLQNSLDLAEVKSKFGENIDEDKKIEIEDNIKQLNRILKKYKEENKIDKEDEKLVVGALATTAIYFDYLADNYSKAAKKAKIIIANISND